VDGVKVERLLGMKE